MNFVNFSDGQVAGCRSKCKRNITDLQVFFVGVGSRYSAIQIRRRFLHRKVARQQAQVMGAVKQVQVAGAPYTVRRCVECVMLSVARARPLSVLPPGFLDLPIFDISCLTPLASS